MRLVILLSDLLVFLFTIAYANYPGSPIASTPTEVFSCAAFWLCIPLSIAVCQLPRVIGLAGMRLISPCDVQVVQELQGLNPVHDGIRTFGI